MTKENKLINKTKRLVKRAGVPRWLHHFGPKKYEFWQHLIALVVKQECRLGYRRISRLFAQLGFAVPTYSALAKMAKRIPLAIWQRILQTTINTRVYIAAIDGTGMSRPLPSPYYYKRIDKPYPVEIPLKLSIAIDTRTKKILSLRVRAKRSHDIKDAKYLIKNLPTKPTKIVADKGYDAEWLHQYCKDKGIKAIIPMRDNGKPRVGVTRLRYTSAKKFKKRVYHRREMVESTFSSIKRKFGASVSSLRISTQRAEIYCRAIAHNIISEILKHFQRCLKGSTPDQNAYK
jgi:transposase